MNESLNELIQPRKCWKLKKSNLKKAFSNLKESEEISYKLACVACDEEYLWDFIANLPSKKDILKYGKFIHHPRVIFTPLKGTTKSAFEGDADSIIKELEEACYRLHRYALDEVENIPEGSEGPLDMEAEDVLDSFYDESEEFPATFIIVSTKGDNILPLEISFGCCIGRNKREWIDWEAAKNITPLKEIFKELEKV